MYFITLLCCKQSALFFWLENLLESLRLPKKVDELNSPVGCSTECKAKDTKVNIRLND